MSKRKWLFLALVAATTLLFFLVGPQGLKKSYYGVRYTDTIRAEAKRHGLSPHLVAAVIYSESRFRPKATSQVGARGLMQLMPATAQEMAQSQGISNFQTDDLDDPSLNIRLGTAYLAHLRGRFHDLDDALAAYNAGPTVVVEWKRSEQGVAYPETRHYVKEVKRHQLTFEELYPEWSQTQRSADDRDS